MELTAATAGATRATGGFLGTSRRRPQSSRGDSAPGLRFWFAIGGVVDSRRVSSGIYISTAQMKHQCCDLNDGLEFRPKAHDWPCYYDLKLEEDKKEITTKTNS
uniref:Uncharacterized protein n=1 Tax=Oryza glumipatula TaxID=40148 RepID=A0A0E0BG24_9ORYZ